MAKVRQKQRQTNTTRFLEAHSLDLDLNGQKTRRNF